MTALDCSLEGRKLIFSYIYGASFFPTYIWRNVLPSNRNKSGYKQENIVLFSSMSLSIHYRYRPVPRRSLATHFRSPMLDSTAQLKHECWLAHLNDWESEGLYFYSEFAKANMKWGGRNFIHLFKKGSRRKKTTFSFLSTYSSLDLILKIFSSLNDSIFPINN